MHQLTLYWNDAVYRVEYDPDTYEIVEVVQFIDGQEGQALDPSELDRCLRHKIERAITV